MVIETRRIIDKNKIVYFFGAGLTTSCGFPTTLDLIETYKRELQTKSNPESDMLKEFNDIIEKYPKPVNQIDIEEIYTFVSKIKTVDFFLEKHDDPIEQTYLRLFYQFNKEEEYDFFKKDIEKFIEDTFWDQDRGNPHMLNQLFPVDFIKNNIKNISLFTTNYDLAVENYFDSIKIGDKLNTGIDIKNKTFSSRILTKRVNKIPYVKLHGSIDLYVDNNGIIRQSDGPISKFGKKIKYGIIPKKYYINYPFLGEPDKDYDKHQENLFLFFNKKIQEAKNIIIIGTSMRDNKIRDIIDKNLRFKNVLLIGNTNTLFHQLPNLEKNKSNQIFPINARYPSEPTDIGIKSFYDEFGVKK